VINRAVEILRSGGLVAFPTETVYGLGADATNHDAILKIFRAKRRPATNPLICHVADVEIAKRYALNFPMAAAKLAAEFWPGPITFVLPKHPSIVDEATAGLNSVGLRVPHHPVALQLLRAFDGAVAAPSANRSNHISPTIAQHVRDELGDSVDLILDGGPCAVGIESTVLDLTSETPRILRPGGVSRGEIERVIGPVSLIEPPRVETRSSMLSPGQLPVHYAPITPAFRFEPGERIGIQMEDAAVMDINLDATAYARQFYARLRMLDRQNLRAIYIELPPDTPEWAAVRDRVLRATRPLS
jgi:L-threonylcarbamoyladenylate synthase